jgi:alpha-tubulin suppressor-like RCC1 family protein
MVLILGALIIFTISAGGCPKKNSKEKTGSSSNNTFMINAPSNLTATAVSSTKVNLYWQDNSNNEDGFEIERSTDGIIYTLLSTFNADTTSYSDSGVTLYFIYYYRVWAFNTLGDRSEYSNDAATATSLICSAVTAGENYTIAQNTNGTLWVCGGNEFGQLGLGHTEIRTMLTRLGSDANWSSNISGYYQTIACKTDRSIWSWGANDFVQLGLGDTVSVYRTTPSLIESDIDWDVFENISAVTAGRYHTIALKTNGTMWGWGTNGAGQLGVGDTLNAEAPIIIGSDIDWTAITARGSHNIARKTNGTIWAWGYNYWGQLGLGTSGDGTDRLTPAKIGVASDWSAVAAGNVHSLAIKSSGTIWSWGANDFGQLGLGYSGPYQHKTIPTKIGSSTKWIKTATGNFCSLAIKADGTLWAWGRNEYGQLGLGNSGDWTSRFIPTQVGNDRDWSTIASGGSHTIALRTNGTVWAWGLNDGGQLGFADTVKRTTPTRFGVPIAATNLIANIVSLSQVDLSWSDNSNNEDGFIIQRKNARNDTYVQFAIVDANVVSYTDTTGFPSAPTYYYYRIRSYNIYGESSFSNEVCVANYGNWKTVTLGYNHSLATKSNSTLWSFGKNSSGQLGLGDSGNGTERNIPTEIGTMADWATGGGGDGYTVSCKTNRTIWAWGNNSYGQLGLGNTVRRMTPAQIGNDSDWSKIACGSNYMIALKTNGILFSWGNNDYGQLGLGDTEVGINKTTPIQIQGSSDWFTVSAGQYHTVSRKTDGAIWAWGNNDYGQLGLGDGEVSINKTTPAQIGNETDWETITAGKNYTIGRRITGTIWGWGDNSYGQLGLGDLEVGNNKAIPTQIGTDTDWVAIAPGLYHTIAIKNNSTIWSWGANDYGQLGLGEVSNITTPASIGTDSDWSLISAKESYTLACKTNSTLWSWGSNQYGQLGLGDMIDRTVPTLMGE